MGTRLVFRDTLLYSYYTMRVFVIFLLPIALFSGALLAQPTAGFIRGDVNRDEKINLADVALIVESFALATSLLLCPDAADVNDDGKVCIDSSPILGGPGDAVSDVDRLMEYLLNLSLGDRLSESLPLPFPAPGVDPTRDEIDCDIGSPPRPSLDMSGFAIGWSSPATVVPGNPIEIFVNLTTGSAIQGISLALIVNTDALDNIVVDLNGTTYQRELEGLVSSRYFDANLQPTLTPGESLLSVAALFYKEDAFGTPSSIAFDLTDGPSGAAKVLRIGARLKPNVPFGGINLLEPFDGVYPPLFQGLGGLRISVVGGVGNTGSSGDLDLSTFSLITIISVEPDFLRGDANADGVADLSDALNTLGFLFTGDFDPLCMDAVDADDSGIADVTDSIHLLTWLFLGGVEVPDPGPVNCGGDPTRLDAGIDLGCIEFEPCEPWIP
jgi:hypothetical protein